MEFNIKDIIATMVKGILIDDEIMTDNVKTQIIKALNINSHLTSCYSLQVKEVQDIKGKTSSESGFYIILEGTRCGVKFFINNDMEIVRKPDKRKVEVKHKYSLYNHNFFDECFWSTVF